MCWWARLWTATPGTARAVTTGAKKRVRMWPPSLPLIQCDRKSKNVITKLVMQCERKRPDQWLWGFCGGDLDGTEVKCSSFSFQSFCDTSSLDGIELSKRKSIHFFYSFMPPLFQESFLTIHINRHIHVQYTLCTHTGTAHTGSKATATAQGRPLLSMITSGTRLPREGGHL